MSTNYHKNAAARIARLRRLTAIAHRLHDIFARRSAAGLPTDHILPRARLIRAAIIAA